MNKKQFRLQTTTHEFIIAYKKREFMEDIEYLILLLSYEAIKQNKSFKKIVIEFLNEDNDLTTVFLQKFESFFGISAINILSIKDYIVKLYEDNGWLGKTIFTTYEYKYIAELEIYLNEEKEFIAEEEIFCNLTKRYIEDKGIKYIGAENTPTTQMSEIDIELEFDEVSGSIKLKDGSIMWNKILADKIREHVGNKPDVSYLILTPNYVFDFDNKIDTEVKFKIGKTIDEISGFIVEIDENRSTIINVKDFDMSTWDKRLDTFKISRAQFKKSDHYDLFLNYMNDLDISQNYNLKKFLVYSADTLKEFKVISNLKLHHEFKHYFFINIDILLKLNLDIFLDSESLQKEFIDYNIEKNCKKTYLYIVNSMNDKNLEILSRNQKNDLLLNIYNSGPDILNSNDLSYIENIVKENSLIKDLLLQIKSSAIDLDWEYNRLLTSKDKFRLNSGKKEKIKEVFTKLESFRNVFSLIVDAIDDFDNIGNDKLEIIKTKDNKLLDLFELMNKSEKSKIIFELGEMNYSDSLKKFIEEINLIINLVSKLK